MTENTLKCKYEISYEKYLIEPRDELKRLTTLKVKAEGTILPILEEIKEVASDIEYDNIDMKEVGEYENSQFGRFPRVKYKLKLKEGWDVMFTIEVISTATSYKVLAQQLREQLGCTVWQSKI